MNNGSNRLLLYDLSISPVKLEDLTWPSDTYGNIRDIAWAKYINAFLVLGEDVLCSYSLTSKQLQIRLNSPSINDQFWSLTVLGCDTFILYRYDALYRYCLPSWTLTRSWSRTDLIQINQTDKYIEQIRAHPSAGLIAILIRMKHHRQWRIDLFDRTMTKLFTGESIRMVSAYPSLMLQPFGNHGRWSLMNEDHIWIINTNGYFLDRSPRKQLN